MSTGNFLACFKLGRTPVSCSASVSSIVSDMPFSSFSIHYFSPRLRAEKTRKSLMYCSAVRVCVSRTFCAQLKTSSAASYCPAANTMSTSHPTSSTLATAKRGQRNSTFSQNSCSRTSNRKAKTAQSLRVYRESTWQTEPTTLLLNFSSAALAVWGERGRRLKARTSSLICSGVTALCAQQRSSSIPPSPSFSGACHVLVSRSLLKSTPVSISRRLSKKLYSSSSLRTSPSSLFLGSASAWACCFCWASAWFFLRKSCEMMRQRGRVRRVRSWRGGRSRRNIQQSMQ